MRLYITPNNICLLWDRERPHRYDYILMRYMNIVINIDRLNDIIKNRYFVYNIPYFTEYITCNEFRSIMMNNDRFEKVFLNNRQCCNKNWR